MHASASTTATAPKLTPSKPNLQLGDWLSYDEVAEEIDGTRNWLADECGIPKDDVVGFRNPYLTVAPSSRQVFSPPTAPPARVCTVHTRRPRPPSPSRRLRRRALPASFLAPSTNPTQVLYDKGFLYDSTLIEGKGYSLSYGMADRVFPCEPVGAWGAQLGLGCIARVWHTRGCGD